MPKKATINDFSGGITDFKHNSAPNKAETCDNLVITKDRGLETRGGFDHYDASAKEPVGSATRVNEIFEYNDELFYHGDDGELYKSDGTQVYASRYAKATGAGIVNGSFGSDSDWGKGTGWTIAGGKATHAVGTESALSQSVTFDLTKGQELYATFLINNLTPHVSGYLYLTLQLTGTSTEYCIPAEVYRGTGSARVNDLGNGLLAYKMVCVNETVGVYNRYTYRFKVPEDATGYTFKIFASANGNYDIDSAGLSLIADIDEQDTDTAAWGTNPTTPFYIDTADVLNHKIITNDNNDSDATEGFPVMKLFYDNFSSKYRLVQAGLPKCSKPSLEQSNTGGGVTYNYVLIYRYVYDVKGVEFVDFSPPSDVLTLTNLNTITYANPVLFDPVNPLTTDDGAPLAPYEPFYDGLKISAELYRQSQTTSTYYYVADVTAGASGFSTNGMIDDGMVEADLAIPLYTTGGVLDNDMPRRMHYVMSVNNTRVYYGKSSGQYMSDATNPATSDEHFYTKEIAKNRVYQAIQDDPDSVPSSIQVNFKQDVNGLGAVGDYPIVFCEEEIFRLDGIVDETGRGSIITKKLHNSAGCISHRSIVRGEKLLYWAGNHGFYVTDGFKVRKISDFLDDTFADFSSTATKKARITSAYDDRNKRVYWATYSDSSSDNAKIYCYDEIYNAFFTLSGNSQFTPSAIFVKDGKLIIGTTDGYVMQQDTTNYVDAWYDGSAWVTTYIPITYKHIAFNFGSPDHKKICNKVTVEAEYDANATVSLQLTSHDNGNTTGKALKEVVYTKYSVADYHGYSRSAPSGFPTSNEANAIIKTRRMDADILRTKYKQLGITNPDIALYYSDLSDFGNVSTSGTTVTLASGTWPTNIEQYTITINSVDYTISSRTNDTVIELTATAGTQSDQEWSIGGQKKGERLKLKSFSYTYDIIGDEGGKYQTAKEAVGND